ncbi:uncharacterized protein [Macrobrachium rosenbergii]|uniref:uncharacterized protein n=1 Tax=Macrobrachium rosenbergii TaxID=79674 RepID=UPI0034D5F61D
MIDRDTSWPEAILIRQQVVESFESSHWMDQQTQSPTDHYERGEGSKLNPTLWNTLADNLRTKLIHTMSYNPEANGIIERLPQSLKASLTDRRQGRSRRKELPWVLLGLRTPPHTTFNASPAEALYGQLLPLPTDVFQYPTSPTSPSDTRKALE